MFLPHFPYSAAAPRPELTAVKDACHLFSLDIIKLIVSYVITSLHAWSLPDADIKRSPQDTLLLAKLDRLLVATRNDPRVNEVLKDLRAKLIFRLGSYRECADESDRYSYQLDKAKRQTIKKYFFEKTRIRREVNDFLDEVRRCDEPRNSRVAKKM